MSAYETLKKNYERMEYQLNRLRVLQINLRPCTEFETRIMPHGAVHQSREKRDYSQYYLGNSSRGLFYLDYMNEKEIRSLNYLLEEVEERLASETDELRRKLAAVEELLTP